MYGLTIEVVTYKGEAPMWQDMGAGSLQAAMGSPQAMNALLVKGDVRRIVAPSRVRYVKLPDVPTSAEQGFDDPALTVRGWLALAAPAATAQGKSCRGCPTSGSRPAIPSPARR